MSYILSHEKKEYYVDIDSVGIKISNHTFFRELHLETEKIDALKKMAKTEATKRRAGKRAKIYKNGIDLLDNIVKNLKNG
jgi:hypothetical protein